MPPQQQALSFPVVHRMSVHPSIVHYHLFCMTRYLCSYWKDFNETCHKYSSHEWAMQKRFARSDAKS